MTKEEFDAIRAHHAAPATEVGRWYGAAHETVGKLIDKVDQLAAAYAKLAAGQLLGPLINITALAEIERSGRERDEALAEVERLRERLGAIDGGFGDHD